MPYVSARQRRYFNAQKGKAISESTVEEWNDEMRGKKLPERAPKKKSGAGGAGVWARRRAASS